MNINLRLRYGYRQVTREELLIVFSSFQKNKSPGLDGWIAEFYIDFFYVLGENFLTIVEEVGDQENAREFELYILGSES